MAHVSLLQKEDGYDAQQYDEYGTQDHASQFRMEYECDVQQHDGHGALKDILSYRVMEHPCQTHAWQQVDEEVKVATLALDSIVER